MDLHWVLDLILENKANSPVSNSPWPLYKGNDNAFTQVYPRPTVKYSQIGHVRYINILTWVRGSRVKIVIFLKFLLSLNSQKSLEYKENNTKYRSLTRLGAMIEYWYIECGLFQREDDLFTVLCIAEFSNLWHLSTDIFE